MGLGQTFKRALDLHQKGQLEEAGQLYEEALQLRPGHFDSLLNLGVIAYQRGFYTQALLRNDAAIAANPESAAAYGLRGLIFMGLARARDAIEQFDRSIVLDSNIPDIYSNRGIALSNLGLHAEAIASFDRALGLLDDFADAYDGRGVAHARLGHDASALDDFTRALALQPDHVRALNNRGALLLTMKRYDEAMGDLDRAIAIAPSDASAHSNRGSALHGLGLQGLALASIDQALAINPDLADAHQNRAAILISQRRYEEAVASARRAVALKPGSADTHLALGTALDAGQHYEEAAASYDRALMLNPKMKYVPGAALWARMHSCLWDGFDARVQSIRARIAAGEPAADSYTLLAVASTPAEQRAAAEMFVRDRLPSAQPAWRSTGRKNHKIRLGYFSTDFHNHATSHLIAGLIECHDRSRFEVFGFAFSGGRPDPMRRRLSQAFDCIIDAHEMPDRQVADLAREAKIDIAVDLMGHNSGNRMRAFCHRTAPVQVTYLGYPGTTGAPCMDYIVADPIVIPLDHQVHFSEKIVALPHSYQSNDSRRFIADRVFSRAELDLPDKGFVFCCFNNNYKLTPDVFDVWMRLLQRVDGSVLWLLEGNASVERNLRAEARKRGVDPTRLVFAKRMSPEDHLARHRAADLMVDTFYYGAHTTASDALWAGVPFVTKQGNAFASRVGGSLLTAVGVPELITHTTAEYETLALTLATEPACLEKIRRRLAENRLTHPLFDTARFTRNIEAAYLQMWHRYEAGLPPDHIHVREGG